MKPKTTTPAVSLRVEITQVVVAIVVRVADETSDIYIDAISDALEERENQSMDSETELLYEAARDHLEAVEKQMAVKLSGDYDITRVVSVKRKSEK